MHRLILLLIACSVSGLTDNHPVPSALSQPRTSHWNDVRFPFECTVEDGALVVTLLDRLTSLKKVEFEWIVPWSEIIDPRHRSQTHDFGVTKQYILPILEGITPPRITFNGAPRKTRVVVKVRAKENCGFWDVTSRGCWTGRRVQQPGPVEKIETLSLEKVVAQVFLPRNPNGPIHGLMLRWCPKSEVDCAPEDVLFAQQMANVDHTFATFLEPVEDKESEPHELCVAAYNIREQERLIGDLKCLRVQPSKS